MIALLWGALAWAGEAPDCSQAAFDELSEAVSVAWVSPSGRTVGRRGRLSVVRTAELRGWLAEQERPTVGRMLQRLGLRRRERTPRRPWKVVIFDVEPQDLCRPVAGYPDPVAMAGLVTCAPRASRPRAGQTGCGHTVDRATGGEGLEQYQGQWADLARNGFCVLPAERFVETVVRGGYSGT